MFDDNVFWARGRKGNRMISFTRAVCVTVIIGAYYFIIGGLGFDSQSCSAAGPSVQQPFAYQNDLHLEGSIGLGFRFALLFDFVQIIFAQELLVDE